MKKKILIVMCGLTAAVVLSGCSNKITADAATSSSAVGTEESGTKGPGTEAAREWVDLDTINLGKITIGKYKGVELTGIPVEVTEEEVEESVQSVVAQNPVSTVITDRGVQTGDVLDINFEGKKDGVAFEGGTAENYQYIVGTTSFIDGFEEGMMGAKTGDVLNLDLTFPKDYGQESLAGQDVVFTVTINSITEQVPAEFNDAFVQNISEFKTVDEYRESIRENLRKQKEEEAQMELTNTALDIIMNESTIEPSQEGIDAAFNNMMVTFTSQAEAYGVDFNIMLSFYGLDSETYEEQFRAQAEATVSQTLILKEIIKLEKLTVSDEEREALAEEYQYESVEVMKAEVGESQIDSFILTQKAVNLIWDNAVIK